MSARCSFCFAARFDFLPRLQFSAHSQRPQGGGRAVEGMDEEWQQRGRDRRSELRAVSRAMDILGMYSHPEAVAVRVVAAIWLRFSLKRLKLRQTWMRHAIWVGRIPDEEFEEC